MWRLSFYSKDELLEILYFTLFYPHSYFESDEHGYRKKVQKTHIPVSVVIDMVTVDTSEEADPEEIRRKIIYLSKDFLGEYRDVEIMRILGLSYSTYYYHKKHIKRAKYRRKEEEND